VGISEWAQGCATASLYQNMSMGWIDQKEVGEGVILPVSWAEFVLSHCENVFISLGLHHIVFSYDYKRRPLCNQAKPSRAKLDQSR
jgi:hypothetical protein